MIDSQVIRVVGGTLVAMETPVADLAAPGTKDAGTQRCHSLVLYSALCRLRLDARA